MKPYPDGNPNTKSDIYRAALGTRPSPPTLVQTIRSNVIINRLNIAFYEIRVLLINVHWQLARGLPGGTVVNCVAGREAITRRRFYLWVEIYQ